MRVTSCAGDSHELDAATPTLSGTTHEALSPTVRGAAADVVVVATTTASDVRPPWVGGGIDTGDPSGVCAWRSTPEGNQSIAPALCDNDAGVTAGAAPPAPLFDVAGAAGRGPGAVTKRLF
jgi:hypothetical protein